MPAAYRIYPSHNLIVVKFAGVVTAEHFERIYRDIRSDAAFSDRQHELSDYSETTELLIGVKEVRSLALHVALSYETPVLSAIVGSSDITYGLARMYQSFADLGGSEKVAVFRTTGPALKWLGLSEVPSEILDFGVE